MSTSTSPNPVSGKALALWISVGVVLGFGAFAASIAALDGGDPDPGDLVKALPAAAAFVALARSADVVLRLVGSRAEKDADKWQAQAYDEVRELYRHCWNGALFSYTLGVTGWFASDAGWAVGAPVVAIFAMGTVTAWLIARGQEKRETDARKTAAAGSSRTTVTYPPKSKASATRGQGSA